MENCPETDLDFAAARVHGRRSRLAEGARLAGLCRLGSLDELARQRWPGREGLQTVGFQRALWEELVGELAALARWLDQPGRELLTWMLARFQVENLKVLFRAAQHQTPLELVYPHLLPVPGFKLPDGASLPPVGRVDQVMDLGLNLAPRRRSHPAGWDTADPRPEFHREAGLDRDYLLELLRRAARVAEPDRGLVMTLVEQEVNTHQLMLVLRARFNYHLPPEELRPLYLPSAGIGRGRFAAMLATSDVTAVAALALGRAIDQLPTGGALPEVEALAAERYRRLANRAFRQSPLGVAAVIGYAGLRRIEVSNLITLSEGLARRLAAESIEARLTPSPAPEGSRV